MIASSSGPECLSAEAPRGSGAIIAQMTLFCQPAIRISSHDYRTWKQRQTHQRESGGLLFCFSSSSSFSATPGGPFSHDGFTAHSKAEQSPQKSHISPTRCASSQCKQQREICHGHRENGSFRELLWCWCAHSEEELKTMGNTNRLAGWGCLLGAQRARTWGQFACLCMQKQGNVLRKSGVEEEVSINRRRFWSGSCRWQHSFWWRDPKLAMAVFYVCQDDTLANLRLFLL